MDTILLRLQPDYTVFKTARTTKLLSLLVGVCVVLLIGYVFGKAVSHNQPTVLKTTSKSINSHQNVLSARTVVSTNTPYTDMKYKFAITLPKGWEAFKRAGDTNAYQIGLRKIGSPDVPITINSQPNTENLSLNAWVDSQYGQLYPRQTVKIAKKDALLINNVLRNYQSYFVLHEKNVHEISVSTINSDYMTTFQSILPSFHFTN